MEDEISFEDIEDDLKEEFGESALYTEELEDIFLNTEDYD